MRKNIREIETNIAYRWFLGYGFNDKIPHFSTFSKNYERRFRDTDIFEQIFYRILMEAVKSGFVKAEEVFIDSTHVKASANKNKYIKKKVRKEVRRYQELLDNEINEARIKHGQEPLKKRAYRIQGS
jgi:transposase